MDAELLLKEREKTKEGGDTELMVTRSGWYTPNTQTASVIRTIDYTESNMGMSSERKRKSSNKEDEENVRRSRFLFS